MLTDAIASVYDRFTAMMTCLLGMKMQIFDYVRKSLKEVTAHYLIQIILSFKIEKSHTHRERIIIWMP